MGGRRGRKQLLRTIDMRAAQGEFVALVGHSGSGKSTILSILGGLIEPDGGTVEVCGHTLTGMSDARRARFRANTALHPSRPQPDRESDRSPKSRGLTTAPPATNRPEGRREGPGIRRPPGTSRPLSRRSLRRRGTTSRDRAGRALRSADRSSRRTDRGAGPRELGQCRRPSGAARQERNDCGRGYSRPARRCCRRPGLCTELGRDRAGTVEPVTG